LAHSERLRELIAREILARNGWISFARYMECALHAPALGYYSAGARKLGAGGDFTTAPEIGGLFGRTLARQVAQILRDGVTDIVELGAGSGKLARDMLAELARLDCLPQRYLILETSADLRQRQQEILQRDLPRHAHRAAWLDAMPAALSAVVIGNEVLDAMPAHMIRTHGGGIDELGVAAREGVFEWEARPAAGALLSAANELGLATDYTTEINLAARSFMALLGSSLARGVVLLIDYGFPAREYYHPQRCMGTLMCHYRHHAHDDPFCVVGLQDITAHVDFSALADAAIKSGLDVLGYASQAQFLINCGITGVLAATPADNAAAYLPLAAQAQKLLSPAEMGELFKVIAFGKNHRTPLLGFASGNKQGLL
jgi:SAM-dependent MidA family methyltransferase